MNGGNPPFRKKNTVLKGVTIESVPNIWSFSSHRGPNMWSGKKGQHAGFLLQTSFFFTKQGVHVNKHIKEKIAHSVLGCRVNHYI